MRKLSIKGDKLRAIAGLADAIKSIQQDDVYLAGIWKRYIASEILWYAIPNSENPSSSIDWPPAPIASGIPTWSWASNDGAVLFDRVQENERSETLSHVQRVSVSCLTLSGMAIMIRLFKTHFESPETKLAQKDFKWPQSASDYQINIKLDTEPKGTKGLDLLCLVVVQQSHRSESSTSLPTYQQSSPGTVPQVCLYLPSTNIASFQTRTISRYLCSVLISCQNILRQTWHGDRSATGLVLLPEHKETSGHKGENPSLQNNLQYRRVGISNAVGIIPSLIPVDVDIL